MARPAYRQLLHCWNITSVYIFYGDSYIVLTPVRRTRGNSVPSPVQGRSPPQHPGKRLRLTVARLRVKVALRVAPARNQLRMHQIEWVTSYTYNMYLVAQ